MEQEEYKYKELYEKLIADSESYLSFVKKLQDENEILSQKLNKSKKLMRAQKVKFN